MDSKEIKESIKKLWAQGITDTLIVCSALSITNEEYEAAITQIKQEYSDYNKENFWVKYVTQVQNRYIEIEEIKEAAMGKNKHQVALECVKAKSDLDLTFMNAAKDNGVLDKVNTNVGKALNNKKFDALRTLNSNKGDTHNELNNADVQKSS